MDISFSATSYREIILRGRKGRTFVSFEDFLAADGWRESVILLRHDVDFSLELAVQLAELNADCGVLGTFFVQLRSPTYNLLTPENLNCIRRIAENGQRLALHYRFPEQPSTAEELWQAIDRELAICRQESGCRFERIISWHNPTPEIIGGENPLDGSRYLSAYHHPFFARGHYYSDSNFRNEPADFLEILDGGKGGFLQLLFHPLYWIIGGDSLERILLQTMEQVIGESEKDFQTNPNWPGRKRIP